MEKSNAIDILGNAGLVGGVVAGELWFAAAGQPTGPIGMQIAAHIVQDGILAGLASGVGATVGMGIEVGKIIAEETNLREHFRQPKGVTRKTSYTMTMPDEIVNKPRNVNAIGLGR